MCRKNHTLVATYTNNGDKTITSCVVGQPLFLIYKPVKTISGGPEYIQYKVWSGATNASTEGGWFCITTDYGSGQSSNVGMIVPSKTSVVIKLEQVDGADQVLIFKQQ